MSRKTFVIVSMLHIYVILLHVITTLMLCFCILIILNMYEALLQNRLRPASFLH